MDAISAVLNLSTRHRSKECVAISENVSELCVYRMVQQWRLGCSVKEGQYLLMRLATVRDTKPHKQQRRKRGEALPYERRKRIKDA
jgi:hypothetical protein